LISSKNDLGIRARKIPRSFLRGIFWNGELESESKRTLELSATSLCCDLAERVRQAASRVGESRGIAGQRVVQYIGRIESKLSSSSVAIVGRPARDRRDGT
jgi:hypothetical protein